MKIFCFVCIWIKVFSDKRDKVIIVICGFESEVSCCKIVYFYGEN